MFKQDVFVSFDYENDKHYKRLLEAWNSNPKFRFVFNDGSSGEIQTSDIGRVKASLTAKINQATHTLVIVGKEANKQHKDHLQIGFKNWINFEIHQSKKNGNKLVAIKLDRTYESPDELLGANASWAMAFEEATIINALSRA